VTSYIYGKKTEYGKKIKKSANMASGLFFMERVGWGEPLPIAALMTALYYAKRVAISQWLLFILTFSLFMVHWFMHSVIGSGGGTWRSIFRCACAEILSMSVTIKIINDGEMTMGLVLLSCIICFMDFSRSLPQSVKNTLKFAGGFLNWGALIILWVVIYYYCCYISSNNNNNNAAKREEKHQSQLYLFGAEPKDFWRNWLCLLGAIDWLASPIKDMSVQKGLIWQILCAISLPIIHNNVGPPSSGERVPAGPSEGGARSKEGPAGGGGYYYHYEEGLAIVLCIVIAQKALFRHWITPTVKDEIHQIYFMACCGSLALCSIKYGPMEGTLLIAKFSLHWLAHICRGVAILNNNNHNGDGGRP
jgi:hypothetical protein